MTLRFAPLWLASLLALTCPALAQSTYVVAGPDLTGRAEVEELGRQGSATRVRVTLTTRRFGEDAGEETVSGTGVRGEDGALRWSYTTEESRGFGRGLIRWLKDPLAGGAAWSPVERSVQVVLRPAGPALRGAVDGTPQRWAVASGLDDLVVLGIPGLSTNSWNRVGIPYLDENLTALRTRGIEARRLAIKTEASVATNAAFIAREVAAEAARGKRVVILAHSKGATDATAALALDPALAAKVVGVIAIQPVYGGSPIADIVAGSSVLRGSVKLVFERVFKGEREAVLDLTHASRSAFVAAHPYPAGRVPTVVVRSTFDRPFGSRSVLWPNQKLIERRDGDASDGMVTIADQTIPGAVATIDLDDLDHFEPGVRGESRHAPVEITNRALDVLLPHLGPSATRAPEARSGAAFDRPLGE